MNWPLMQNNITTADLTEARYFLNQAEEGIPRLTQGEQVALFEREFAAWLGCKYAVMVNSGSSANLITLAALKERVGADHPWEVIVPTITWVSDIAAVLHAGFKPVFVDIDPATLGMDFKQVFDKINKNTKAVFVTHVLGFNAIPHPSVVERLSALQVEVIEDCCEATGATMLGRKLGTFGMASNFSFYYAHHMTTIEGGMVCTDKFAMYEQLRRLRSHGLIREMSGSEGRQCWYEMHEDLDPQFIFAVPAYNVRSTEINAVIGRSQLRRLDENNDKRSANLRLWLEKLDPKKYQTEFFCDGASNYALPLVLLGSDGALMRKVMELLADEDVEYRRGTAGGGNQLRQPYLKAIMPKLHYERFPLTEHVHWYGLYIGNYPELKTEQILRLCTKLNDLST